MADVIAVVAGVIGIFSFIEGLFPPKNPADYSSLRIGVALNGNGLIDADEAVKRINVYNEDQTLIGHGQGGRDIKSGGFQDITIDQSEFPGQQPTYIQINAGTHGLRIAYITQVWPDGTKRGWLGNMGQACGTSYWAYSNIIVSDDGHKPACTWLDQDHSGGIKAAAVQIHMQDFTNLTSNYTRNPDSYCHLPTMIFESDMDETGQPNSFWNSRRALVKRRGSTPQSKIKSRSTTVIKSCSAAISRQIISSQDASHSALKLCHSATSHSPDFVSFSEGVFCDMATKIPWPLCLTTTTDNCYVWDTHTLITGGIHKAKDYSLVENWR